MPGKFIDCKVWNYLYPYNHFLDKNNTFITIFGPNQYMYLEKIIADKRLNILYKSLKAINTKYAHEDKLARRTRNTVVVWEWNENLP
jgi:hypothetical protein